jgi:hypothetical protein
VKGLSTTGRGFISYRRKDGDALAENLKTRFETELPGWSFFLDFRSIEAGDDFKSSINNALDGADVVIALIGMDWVGQQPPMLQPRIFQNDDLVRHEIVRALDRKARIIPVLVNDAKMPIRNSLPNDVEPITRIHALELRISRFDDDLSKLLEAISGRTHAKPNVHKTRRMWGGLFGLLTAAFAGVLLLLTLFRVSGSPLSDWVGGQEAVLITVLWLVLGALVGIRWTH